MDLIICSNCGCNITEDDDEFSPYILRVEVPTYDESSKKVEEFQLCRCCAEGIYNILASNEEMLLNMHGQTCGDILPVGYRCVHSPAGHC